jgi:hypothetical protein
MHTAAAFKGGLYAQQHHHKLYNSPELCMQLKYYLAGLVGMPTGLHLSCTASKTASTHLAPC